MNQKILKRLKMNEKDEGVRVKGEFGRRSSRN
jgi:hypothetical protein